MEWWRWEGWPTAEEWQAVWAFATVVVAAVAAALALRQYRASVRSQVEQARPFITVDFAFRPGNQSLVMFEVKNSGLTAAEDIRLDWSDPPRAATADDQPIIDRLLVKEGIPSLAPGKSIRLYVGYFSEDLTPRRYRVKATYRGSGDNEEWTSRSTLDLDQWAHAMVDRDPYASLAKPLRDLAARQRRTTRSYLGPDPKDQAAEALLAYINAKPEVKRYRRKRERQIAEEDRRAREDLERSIRFASEDDEAMNAPLPEPLP